MLKKQLSLLGNSEPPKRSRRTREAKSAKLDRRPSRKDDKYLTVTALNKYIHAKFTKDPYLKQVYVKGEISNFRYRPHTHQYFRLKDQQSSIDAVMFYGFAKYLKFKPKEGMKVDVTGWVSTYTKAGEYEFYVRSMTPTGVGSLYEAYVQLKKQLDLAGYFSPALKKPLPEYPKSIAVITSRNGAVIRDIINTTRSRWPSTQLVLYPAEVQGEKAEPSLVRQLKNADSGHYDDIIIGRGGGSIEDLWAFNEKPLAQAIHNCRTPVISSVGHGTDHPICDFVADKRVVTPTAAAEAATPDIKDIQRTISENVVTITTFVSDKISQLGQQLAKLRESPVYTNPERIYQAPGQKLQLLEQRLLLATQHRIGGLSDRLDKDLEAFNECNPKQMVEEKSKCIALLSQKLNEAMHDILVKKQNAVAKRISTLNAVSPLKTLSRGYSIVTADHKAITDINTVKPGENVNLKLRNGHAKAKIISTQKD